MATLFHTSYLPVSPEVAWERIAAVGKVHEIVPAIATCTVDGDRRFCTFADGAVLKERLISVDRDLMRLAYTITESPFGLEYHSAALQIVAEGSGARLLWTTDIKPDGLKDSMQPLFGQLFGQLTESLSAA